MFSNGCEAELFQEGSEGEFLVLSDFISEKGKCSQKNVFDDEGVFQGFFGGLLFSVGLDEGSETKGIPSVDFLLEKSGEFRDALKFGDLIFEDLISEGFKEFLLFSLLIFDFFFNDLGQLPGKLFFVGY